jgi:hypothetical protein
MNNLFNLFKRRVKNPDIKYTCKANEQKTTHKDLGQKLYSLVSSDYLGMDVRIVFHDE